MLFAKIRNINNAKASTRIARLRQGFGNANAPTRIKYYLLIYYLLTMRLLGINIPDNKRMDIALRYFYGIGPGLAVIILTHTKIDPANRAKALTPEESNRVKEFVEKNYKIEGELRQVVRGNISRLREIGSYRGARHSRKLPVRGQRTKTNSRTVRGNTRKTVGSGKRKVDLK